MSDEELIEAVAKAISVSFYGHDAFNFRCREWAQAAFAVVEKSLAERYIRDAKRLADKGLKMPVRTEAHQHYNDGYYHGAMDVAAAIGKGSDD